jgi:hypothetical protein
MKISFCFAVIVLHLLSMHKLFAEDNSDPAARAILYRFLQTRESDDNIDLSFSYRQEHYPEMNCRLEMVHGMRRLEIFRANGVKREISFIDHEYAWHFTDDADLIRTDLKTADIDGWFCFDPRTLGMAEVTRISHELRNMLVENAERFELIGRRAGSDSTIYELRVHRDGAFFDYTIEEPTMRLHQKRVQTSSGKTDIALEYVHPWQDLMDWVPSRVVATREPGGYRSEFRNVLRNRAPVPSERFTLKGLEIPIGTTVVDNLLRKRLGYWDGEGISEAFPGTAPNINRNRLKSDSSRLTLIFFLTVPVLIMAFVFVRRRQLYK